LTHSSTRHNLSTLVLSLNVRLRHGMRNFSLNYEPVPDLRDKQFLDIEERRRILQIGPCHIVSTQDKVHDI